MMELHCATLCCYADPDGSRKILIAKRSNDRKVLPGKWEFGAAKPLASEKMVDTIKKEYLADFNIHINPITDEDGYPLPFYMYEVERDGELHKGVNLVAEILDPENIKITNKHIEYKFDTYDNILSEISDSQAVPGFRKMIELLVQLRIL